MVLLAKKWNSSIDPRGWLVSEKLDGHRATWDGKQFISRGGNIITSPEWFTKGFPKEGLDGELWAGRRQDGIDLVASAAGGSRDRDWNNIVYAVFDAPDYKDIFENRIHHSKIILDEAAHGIVIPFWVCESTKQLLAKLDEVVEAGGEGLMLRKPGSRYERKRSDTLLKVKKQFTAEAVVIEHVEGTRPGLCGSLRVINKDSVTFKVASGITEAMAHNPPPIGTVITYGWELLTKDGKPRPATFLRIRKDL